jgi:hypothetical protein
LRPQHQTAAPLAAMQATINTTQSSLVSQAASISTQILDAKRTLSTAVNSTIQARGSDEPSITISYSEHFNRHSFSPKIIHSHQNISKQISGWNIGDDFLHVSIKLWNE